MRSAFEFLGIIFLCVLMPVAFLAIAGAQVEPYDQTAASVVTGGGITTATLTLTNTPDPNRAASITAIVSSLETDVPLIQTYNVNTYELTIEGLTASSARMLTITYNIEATFLSGLPFAGNFFTVLIYLLIAGLVTLLVMFIVGTVRNRRGSES
jgi:hypothetical protein